jgi:hypothetical protein
MDETRLQNEWSAAVYTMTICCAHFAAQFALLTTNQPQGR